MFENKTREPVSEITVFGMYMVCMSVLYVCFFLKFVCMCMYLVCMCMYVYVSTLLRVLGTNTDTYININTHTYSKNLIWISMCMYVHVFRLHTYSTYNIQSNKTSKKKSAAHCCSQYMHIPTSYIQYVHIHTNTCT